jgi:LytS/YehU family sensor histidine kinase
MNRQVDYKGEILIVDDDPANLDLLSGMLIERRYDIRVANSGHRAIAAVKSSIPDLILLDVNMPKMNGYEVCRRIKADPNSHSVPVIFISANDETIDKVEAFSAGGVDYITKPVQLEELIARIEAQLKIARLSNELQMQMLRYQLDPHFLFNALISIRALVGLDSSAAEEMITKLSDYLRYLMTSRNRLDIPVREEIEAAENYLAIEKIRFEERLKIGIDVDPSIGECLMPAFILQPLLENAIKYGMKTSPRPLEIELSARSKDDMLTFRVSNTGSWMTAKENDIPQNASLGVGLQNIRQRLRQRYQSNHNFAIGESNRRVHVIIEIPIGRQ